MNFLRKNLFSTKNHSVCVCVCAWPVGLAASQFHNTPTISLFSRFSVLDAVDHTYDSLTNSHPSHIEQTALFVQMVLARTNTRTIVCRVCVRCTMKYRQTIQPKLYSTTLHTKIGCAIKLPIKPAAFLYGLQYAIYNSVKNKYIKKIKPKRTDDQWQWHFDRHPQHICLCNALQSVVCVVVVCSVYNTFKYRCVNGNVMFEF